MCTLYYILVRKISIPNVPRKKPFLPCTEFNIQTSQSAFSTKSTYPKEDMTSEKNEEKKIEPQSFFILFMYNVHKVLNVHFLTRKLPATCTTGKRV